MSATIFEAKEFTDGEKSITLLVPVEGRKNLSFAKGTISIRANTPSGPMSIPFSFDFPTQGEWIDSSGANFSFYDGVDCSSPDDKAPQIAYVKFCFASFKETADKAFEEFKRKKHEDNLIVPASQIPQNNNNNVIQLR